MERLKRKFVPEWSGPIEGWAVKECKKHLWRVAPAMTFEDLYQEAGLCFAGCRERYASVTEAKHFMALFKRVFSSKMHRLANRRRHSPVILYLEEESMLDSLNEASLLDMELELEEAPEDVRRVVAGAGSTSWRANESGDEFLSRVGGFAKTLPGLFLRFEAWLRGEVSPAQMREREKQGEYEPLLTR